MTLVTGSTGFLGRHVMAAEPDAYGFDLEDGDIAEGVPAHKGRYIHLAALAGIQQCQDDPGQCFDVNVRGTLNVLEAVRTITGASMVLASSAAVCEPYNPYAASKAAAEVWVNAYRLTYGVQATSLRLANVYGPGSMHKTSVVAAMCRSALQEGRIIVHGDGEQRRDFVHVRDAVDALRLPLVRPLMEVSTGKLTSVLQVARHIADLSGARVEHKGLARETRRPQTEAPRLQLVYTPWREGVAETFEWFKEEMG